MATVATPLNSAVPRLKREITAFGLYLLKLRLERDPRPHSPAWLENVRHACLAASATADDRPGQAGESEFGLQLASWDTAEGPTRAREAYEQFCLSTGLGGTALVGRGENLAALIFYITLHALASRQGLPTRDQVRVLLKAAQEVRKHLQTLVDELALGARQAGNATPMKALTGQAEGPLFVADRED